MNRNRGIICIILGILVCGVLLTSFNSRMLKKQQEEMARDEVIREAAYGNEAAYGGEAGYGAVNSRMYAGSAAAREEEISPASAGEQETELQPGEEEESAPVPSDSGQDGAAAEGAEPAEAEEDLTGESPAQPSAERGGRPVRPLRHSLAARQSFPRKTGGMRRNSSSSRRRSLWPPMRGPGRVWPWRRAAGP